MNSLEKRVIAVSYKKGLSHLSSTLSCVNVIDKIYSVKKPRDIFVLSNGHAALALYVVLEQWEFKNAEALYDKHGVHPNRNLNDGIYCSSGSLGSAVTLAVGMALADKTRDVYVMLSDGECAEGTVWEALAIASKLRIENLRVTVVCNGTGAYGKIDTEILDTRLQLFYPSLAVHINLFSLPDYLQSFDGHYKVLNETEYMEVMKL